MTFCVKNDPSVEGRYRNCDPLLLGKLIKQSLDNDQDKYLRYPQKELFDKSKVEKKAKSSKSSSIKRKKKDDNRKDPGYDKLFEKKRNGRMYDHSHIKGIYVY